MGDVTSLLLPWGIPIATKLVLVPSPVLVLFAVPMAVSWGLARWIVKVRRKRARGAQPPLLGAMVLAVGLWLGASTDGAANTDNPYFPYHPDEFTTVLYHLDEPSGAVVEDASGHGLDGSIAGTAFREEGRFGLGLRFDGQGKLDTSDSDLFRSSSLTLEAWIYVTERRTAVLLDTRALDIPVDTGRALLITEEGQVFAWAQQAHSPAYWAASQTRVALNTWTHVAGVFDGTQAKVSVAVNGIVEDTAPAFGYVGASHATVAGSLAHDGEYFVGRVDEVRISSIARELQPVGASTTSWGRVKSLYSND